MNDTNNVGFGVIMSKTTKIGEQQRSRPGDGLNNAFVKAVHRVDTVCDTVSCDLYPVKR